MNKGLLDGVLEAVSANGLLRDQRGQMGVLGLAIAGIVGVIGVLVFAQVFGALPTDNLQGSTVNLLNVTEILLAAGVVLGIIVGIVAIIRTLQ